MSEPSLPTVRENADALGLERDIVLASRQLLVTRQAARDQLDQ